jgi:hypothetical protein
MQRVPERKVCLAGELNCYEFRHVFFRSPQFCLTRKAEVYTVATILLRQIGGPWPALLLCGLLRSAKDIVKPLAPMGTYYETLGITRDASPELIKHAHRSLVKVWHPDKFPEGSEAEAEASRRIREINAAYTVLSNARTRANYDAKLSPASRMPSAAYPRTPEHCSQCGKATTYWDTAGGKTKRLCYACGV